MKIMNKLMCRGIDRQQSATVNTSRITLTRTFVETGDERCPLAGIWSRLPEQNATEDDPGLSWPAMRVLLFARPVWRAFHLRLNCI